MARQQSPPEMPSDGRHNCGEATHHRKENTLNPEHIEMLNRYLMACQHLEIGGITDCFSENAIISDPTGTYTGREQVHTYFRGLYSGLSGLSFETGPLFWNGASCAIAWKGQARRHDATLLSYEGIDVFTFNGSSEISHLTAFWTPQELMGPTVSDE